MVDGVASLMGMVYAMRAQAQWRDERGVNFLDGSCPFGTSYETGDGKYVLVCAVEPPFYARLLEGLNLDAGELPAQYDRRRWPELRERFTAIFKTRTRDDWTARLEMLGACVSPVLGMAEAPQHPHNLVRGVFIGDDAPVPAVAPRFSVTPSSHAPRDLGRAHETLQRWGATDGALRAIEAVAA